MRRELVVFAVHIFDFKGPVQDEVLAESSDKDIATAAVGMRIIPPDRFQNIIPQNKSVPVRSKQV